jgi:hypothetical protein
MTTRTFVAMAPSVRPTYAQDTVFGNVHAHRTSERARRELFHSTKDRAEPLRLSFGGIFEPLDGSPNVSPRSSASQGRGNKFGRCDLSCLVWSLTRQRAAWTGVPRCRGSPFKEFARRSFHDLCLSPGGRGRASVPHRTCVAPACRRIGSKSNR